MQNFAVLLVLLLIVASYFPSAVMAADDTGFQTSNGAKTSAQLRDELATAGYGGPWDVGSMLAAYERAVHPPCQLQQADWSGDPTSVDFLGRGQVTGRIHNSCTEVLDVEVDVRLLDSSGRPIGDARTAYIQDVGPGKSGAYSIAAEGMSPSGNGSTLASWSYHKVSMRDSGGCFDVGAARCLQADVWLSGAIFRLQETVLGRQLLRTAADYGVRVVRARPTFGTYATYNRGLNLVKIDPLLDNYSAWERAAILSHELRHAADAASGLDMDSTNGCYTTEQNAFTDEGRIWGELWQNRLPTSTNSVQADLNEITLKLARDPYAFVGQLITNYKHQCAG